MHNRHPPTLFVKQFFLLHVKFEFIQAVHRIILEQVRVYGIKFESFLKRYRKRQRRSISNLIVIELIEDIKNERNGVTYIFGKKLGKEENLERCNLNSRSSYNGDLQHDSAGSCCSNLALVYAIGSYPYNALSNFTLQLVGFLNQTVMSQPSAPSVPAIISVVPSAVQQFVFHATYEGFRNKFMCPTSSPILNL